MLLSIVVNTYRSLIDIFQYDNHYDKQMIAVVIYPHYYNNSDSVSRVFGCRQNLNIKYSQIYREDSLYYYSKSQGDSVDVNFNPIFPGINCLIPMN